MTKHDSTETTTAAVMPVAEIASPTYVHLVERWNGFAQEAAKSVIGLANTLADAKSSLPAADFDRFCEEIGLDQKGSTYRKLKKIGEKYARFAPFITTMPNAWTTVYTLACLDEDEFDRISPNLHPFMTAGDIADLLHGKGDSEKVTRDLMIDLGTLEPKGKIAVCKQLFKLGAQLGFHLKPSSKLVRLIEKENKKPRSIEAIFVNAIGDAS